MSTLLALARAAHFFPLTVVVCLTALIGATALDGLHDVPRLTLVTASMFFSQLAIGWSNDYLDRETDALYQPSKPVPSGLVQAEWLPVLTIVALALSLLLGAALGFLPLLLLVAGTAAGLAYNLGLKNTAWSWLPYVLAFAVLPPFVWSALDAFRSEYAWLYVFATPLVLAAHLANALPDAETDRQAGHRGIVVVLGSGGARAALLVCLSLPLVLALLSAVFIEVEARILVPLLIIYGALAAGAGWAGARALPGLGFKLTAVAGALLAAGWLAAV